MLLVSLIHALVLEAMCARAVYWTEDKEWRQMHWPSALVEGQEVSWSLAQGILTLMIRPILVQQDQQSSPQVQVENYLLPSDVAMKGQVMTSKLRAQDLVLRFQKTPIGANRPLGPHAAR